MIYLLHGGIEVVGGYIAHLLNDFLCLIKGKGRGGEEPLIESVEGRDGVLVLFFHRLILDDTAGDVFKYPGKRQKHNSRYKSEESVDVGDSAGIERSVPESVVQDAGTASDQNEQETEDGGKHIVNDVHHSRTSLHGLRADAAHKVSRETVSDIDTDDDSEHRAEGHTDRARYRLYDTHDGR